MASTPIVDYVPEDEWPAVSTMLEVFGEHTLVASPSLAGSSIVLLDENDSTTEYMFQTATTLHWKSDAAQGATTGTATYKAIEAREGIFIVDFVVGDGIEARNTTFVHNTTTGVTTSGFSTFVTGEDKVRGKRISSMPPHPNAPAHPRSSELVGRRIYYRYSDSEAYEHIYLTPGAFTWHCVRGGEQGMADTERCMTFDVAEDLYLFFWTEKVMTVEAVLLVDLREKRSIGRMFGWEDSSHEPVVLPFNSRLSILNTTTYPHDHNKH